MGEIKSTLDLVMEKTKHLKLSSQEKQQQQTLDIEKHLKGLLQKFLDQTLSRNQLHKHYQRLKQEANLSDDSIFINEILNRLDLGKDNRLLLALIKAYCMVDPAGLESVFNGFQDAVDSAAAYRKVKLREDLSQKYLVSGSAVIPNLEADPEWQVIQRDLRSKFETRLAEQKAGLVSGAAARP